MSLFNPKPNSVAADPLVSTAPGDVVLLFGEVLFDVFGDHRTLGGAPFNVGRHLRAFGLYPVLVTRTGTDPERSIVIDSMKRFGLDVRGVQTDPTHPTGSVIVETKDAGHTFKILADQAYDYINPALARLTGLSAQPRLFYFGTLAQRNVMSRRALQSLLRCLDAPTFVDVNLRKPWYDVETVRLSLRSAYLLKVNVEELAELARLLRFPSSGIATTARKLIEAFEIRQILVTQGDRGATLYEKSDAEYTVNPGALRDRIIDTVGSGDGFSAVFILGWLRQWPVELTMSRADRFARSLCLLRGAVPDDDAFYDSWREEWGLREPQ